MKSHFIVIALSFLFCSSAWATTRYVDGNLRSNCTSGNYSIANRNCTGSNGNAWNTISGGLSNTAAGDTLLIRAGTYAEQINSSQVTNGISDSQRTNIQAYNGETVTLRPSGGSGVINLANKSNITLDGLDLDGVNTNESYTVALANSSNITFQNGRIRNAPQSGSACFTQQSGGTISNIRLINNEIGPCSATTGPQPNFSHAVYIAYLTNSLIERNYIHGASSHGIHGYNNGQMTADNNIIRYNYIKSNGSQCIRTESGDDWQIYGNICDSNGGDGIHNESIASNDLVFNNTFYNNGGLCMWASLATGWQVRNNLCLSNTTNKITLPSATLSTNVTSTSLSLVVNAAGANFTPSQGSPLIDAGTTLGLPSGYSYLGSAPDIGAVEYRSGVIPPPAPSDLTLLP